MPHPTCLVDLSDPGRLAECGDRFLRHGVCPVQGVPCPPLLAEVTLDVRLPGGERAQRTGRVIRQEAADAFLVQLDAPIAYERPDVPTAQERPDAPTGTETADSDLYARIRDLPLPEKQRLARQGHRTARQLLARDLNKALHVLVVANPQVTLEEAAEYAAMPGLSKEALEYIAGRPTWLGSRKLVFALVRNPTLPAEVAIRLLPRLGPSEWRLLARPGAVRPLIAAAARRLVVD